MIAARREANLLKAARESAKLHTANPKAAREGQQELSRVLHHKDKQWMEQPVGAAKHLPFDKEAGSKAWIQSTVHHEEQLAGTESERDKAHDMLAAAAKGVRETERARMHSLARRRGRGGEEREDQDERHADNDQATKSGGRDEEETRRSGRDEEERHGENDEVGEDDDGHLVVRHRARGGALDNRQEEDGHYSEREESFKKALAAAYRRGYEGEDAEVDGKAGGGGAAEEGGVGVAGPPGMALHALGHVVDHAVQGDPERSGEERERRERERRERVREGGGRRGQEDADTERVHGQERGEGDEARGRGAGDARHERGGRADDAREREGGRERRESREEREDGRGEERGDRRGEARKEEPGGQQRGRGGGNIEIKDTDSEREEEEEKAHARLHNDLKRDTGQGTCVCAVEAVEAGRALRLEPPLPDRG